MASKLKDVLARIASELEDEEAKDEIAELRAALAEGKRVTIADIRDAISEAPPEERAQLRQILAEELDGEPAPKPNGDPPPRRRKKDPPAPPPSGRKTRPGRKSGMAYDWYVDNDGKVVRSPTATIYSGEDEPDEVEMFPDEPDDDDAGADDDKGGGDGE